jgi:hypothetical protein
MNRSRKDLPDRTLGTNPMSKRGLTIIGLLVVIAAVIAAISIANRGSEPLTSTGDQFMTALKNHDMMAAFSILYPELRGKIGQTAFEDIFKEAGVLGWSFKNQSVQDGQGYLSGEATIDQQVYAFELKFMQVDGRWQLTEYHFDR